MYAPFLKDTKEQGARVSWGRRAVTPNGQAAWPPAEGPITPPFAYITSDCLGGQTCGAHLLLSLGALVFLSS